MKYVISALFLIALCSCIPKVPPYIPPGQLLVYVEVYRAQSEGVKIPHAQIDVHRYLDQDWEPNVADEQGNLTLLFPVGFTGRDVPVRIKADDYVTLEGTITVGPEATAQIFLVPIYKRFPWRPSRAAVKAVKANFGSSRDSKGRVILDWFLPTLPGHEQEDWFNRKRAAGLTHIVLHVAPDYGGQTWYHSADYRSNPEAMRAQIELALEHEFVPIVFLCSGDRGTGNEPQRVWPSLLPALRDLAPYCIWVPGFEVVGPGGGWSSKQLSDAIGLMRRLLGSEALIYVHLAPTRFTGASHPVESDDPWRGDEIGFWSQGNGRELTGVLYQTEHGDPLLHPERYSPAYNGERGYLERVKELAERCLVGGHGWRKVEVVIFETTTYDYLQGRATDADTARIARECARFGFRWFGSGLPQ